MALSIAATVGQWLAAGFVHGVLNTDNFNITGESFDYGPWRFLPAFDPGLVAAYFDQTGRYAYGRQSDAALWALCRLADSFLLLIDKSKLEARLPLFYPAVEASLASQVKWRLGVVGNSDDQDRDAALTRAFLPLRVTVDTALTKSFMIFMAVRRVDGYDTPAWHPFWINCRLAPLRPHATAHFISDVPKLFR